MLDIERRGRGTKLHALRRRAVASSMRLRGSNQTEKGESSPRIYPQGKEANSISGVLEVLTSERVGSVVARIRGDEVQDFKLGREKSSRGKALWTDVRN